MDFIEILSTFGKDTAILVACGWFIYKLVNRFMDESAKREESTTAVNKEVLDNNRELLGTNKELLDTNKELSETNRLLVDKITDNLNSVSTDIKNIKKDVVEVLHKLDK